MRAGAAALLLLAACFRPDLGPAPFTCVSDACPRGYHCASGVCVGGGEPDPGWAVAVVGGESDPHVAWVAERRFTVVWAQEAESALGASGLYAAPFSEDGLGSAGLVAPATGALGFTLARHEAAGQLVVAARINGAGHATLQLYAQPIAGGSAAARLVWQRDEAGVPEGLGFSVPAVAERGAGSVMLAYTLAVPPAIAADNVFCTTVDLGTGATDDACRPATTVTRGTFASEVQLAARASDWLLYWRDLSTHVVGDPAPRLDLGFARVVHPTLLGGQVAAAVRNDTGSWSLALGSATTGALTRSSSGPGSPMVPHLVAGADQFVACGLDVDGELVVLRLSPVDLSALGAATRISRVTTAAIESCRVALADDGTVAITWRERLATGTNAFRLFAALLPPKG